MKPKVMYLVTAVMSFVNGVVTLVSPTTQLAIFGISGSAATSHMAQWAGLGTIVVGVVAWFGASAASPEAGRPFAWILLVYYLIAAPLAGYGVFTGAVGGAGAVPAMVSGLFALGYGACLITNP